MGVRKLNKYLTNLNIIKTYQNINEFVDENKTINISKSGKFVIAIDFWLYAHKFLYSSKPGSILMGFLNQIIKFLSCGAIPLYVIDGSVPIEKLSTVEERNRKRNNYKKKLEEIDFNLEKYSSIDEIFYKELDDEYLETVDKREKLQKKIKRIKITELHNIYKLFDILNIVYIRAEYEADALCAKLYKENIINCCLSDDMDMLALGCGSTIKFSDGKVIEYNLEHIKRELNFTQEQFIDMCIIFGCDYLQHPIKIDCEDVHELLKKHGSLLDALCANEHDKFNMSNRNVRVIGENYYLVKDVYLTSCDKETVDSVNVQSKKINPAVLIDFLKKTRQFDTSLNSTQKSSSSKYIGSIKNSINNINKIIEVDN